MWYSAVGWFVTCTLGLLAVLPITMAQPQGKRPLVGVLEPESQQRSACIAAFQQGLRDLGYVEGQTIAFAYRAAEEHPDRLAALAAELVQLTPDVLWLHSTPAAWAAKRATTTIPIVVAVASELVEQGLVASLARPGGNLTGLDFRTAELLGKQLELFKEAVPTITRVAVLVDPARADLVGVPSTMAQEALALGVQLQRVEAGRPDTFEAAFAAMVHDGVDALLIMSSAYIATHQQQLLALALRHRLPTMGYGRRFAEAGSLLAYGVDSRELCQRSAVFVHKILHGATPADISIERVDKFPLVVNLKTAADLGVTLPPTFLAQVDEVLK